MRLPPPHFFFLNVAAGRRRFRIRGAAPRARVRTRFEVANSSPVGDFIRTWDPNPKPRSPRARRAGDPATDFDHRRCVAKMSPVATLFEYVVVSLSCYRLGCGYETAHRGALCQRAEMRKFAAGGLRRARLSARFGAGGGAAASASGFAERHFGAIAWTLARARARTPARARASVRVRARVRARAHVCVRACVRACVCVCARACVCACACVCVRARARAHVCVRARAHVCALARALAPSGAFSARASCCCCWPGGRAVGGEGEVRRGSERCAGAGPAGSRG